MKDHELTDKQAQLPLATLLRCAGQPTNFNILRALTQKTFTPNELSEQLHYDPTKVRSQLKTLRKMGFVSYKKDGRKHHYRIRNQLPTFQHELIIQLVKIDRSDPSNDPFEEDVNPLAQDTLDKIHEKEKELFNTKMEYFVSFSQPGVTTGKNQDYLTDKIDRIKREISKLRINEEK